MSEFITNLKQQISTSDNANVQIIEYVVLLAEGETSSTYSSDIKVPSTTSELLHYYSGLYYVTILFTDGFYTCPALLEFASHRQLLIKTHLSVATTNLNLTTPIGYYFITLQFDESARHVQGVKSIYRIDYAWDESGKISTNKTNVPLSEILMVSLIGIFPNIILPSEV